LGKIRPADHGPSSSQETTRLTAFDAAEVRERPEAAGVDSTVVLDRHSMAAFAPMETQAEPSTPPAPVASPSSNEDAPASGSPRVAPADSPRSTRSPRSRLAFWLLLAGIALIVAGILLFAVIHVQQAGAGSAQQSGSSAPRPGENWSFPPLRTAPHQAILIFTNPNARRVGVQVTILASQQNAKPPVFRVPAHSQAEMELARTAVLAPIVVLADAPIGVQRVVINGGHVSSSNGIRSPGP
jgi:hypothetical protein